MPLTPIDVQQKTFRVALRGYAEDEVDEFLDEVVLSIREYEQRLEEMSFQVGTLESQLSENRQTEDAMRRTLLLAEKTAADITDEANREAERIVSEARAEATSLTSEQSEERDSLIDELGRLRQIVADVQDRLRDIAGDTERRLAPVANEVDDTLDSLQTSPEVQVGRPGLVAVPGGRAAVTHEHESEPQADTSWSEEGDFDGSESPSDGGLSDADPDEWSDTGEADEPGPRRHRFWGGPAAPDEDVSDQDAGEERAANDPSDRGSLDSEHRYDGPNLAVESDEAAPETIEVSVDRDAEGEASDSGWAETAGRRSNAWTEDARDSVEDGADEATDELTDEARSRGGFVSDAVDRVTDADGELDATGAETDERSGADDDTGRRRPWERFTD